jgi:FkbM family methyltransferase
MKSGLLRAKLFLLATLSRVRSKIAGPHCVGFLNQANGVFLIAAVTDLGVGRRLAFDGCYDTGQLEKYQRLVTPETRLLVVGAHVGSILLPLAKIAREAVGIEASPESFRLLEMNVAINGLTNCPLHNVAAYDAPGALEFVASKVNSGGAKVLPQSRRFEFFYDHPEIISVRSVRLDDELPGDFDFVLMDIEGAEYRAIAGMQRILSTAKHFICEVVPNHLENVDPCTFEQFVARIPEQFRWFSLTDDERVVDRSGLAELYSTIHRDYYFGGANLICCTENGER